MLGLEGSDMNAARVIEEVTSFGIQIRTEGNDLLLQAEAKPPTSVLELLTNYKADIVRLLKSGSGRLDHALLRLECACPDYVDIARWQGCIGDARRFLRSWGSQAEAIGWTAKDLFGLHELPTDPHPSYQRLSRYDGTGLLWLLRGRRVLALTETTAAIQSSGSSPLIYRRRNKPALGPLGDSLEDLA
jgi:hypothetical protein